MGTRLLLTLLLLLELAGGAAFAVVLTNGRILESPGTALYLGGLIAGVAVIVALGLPRKWLGRLTTHGALWLGCVLFILPFAWLVTTTFKYDEEVFVYPPRWIPAMPEHPSASPFVTDELLEPADRPDSVEPQRWAQLRPEMEEVLWRRALELLADEQPQRFDPQQLRSPLVRGLLASVAGGMAPAVWQQPDEQVIEAALSRADLPRAREVWRRIYRSVELRDLTVKDIDRIEHRPGPEAIYLDRWTGRGAIGTPTLIRDGDTRLTVPYDFQQSGEGVLTGVFPLPVSPQRVLSVTLPMRQDRSWHRFRPALEFAGVRYEPLDDFSLRQWQWQELTFKIQPRDPKDERDLGIWPLVPVAAADAFNEPGRFRLELTFERSAGPAAIWRKYTDSYRQAYLVTEHRWNYVFNSFYLVALTVIGQLISCSLVAFAFSRLNWPGRDVLFIILLATMMLPPQVTMVPLFIVFKHLDWYNTLKALWVPSFFGTAFFIFLLRQFMMTIPDELEDAAKVDGCSYFGIYWRVILPLMKPALAAVAIFTFMNTWNDFMGPLIYLNDQRLYPLSLGIFEFRSEYQSDFRMLMAASTLMTLPIIAVFFLAQRYFIEGITMTGMKG